MKLVAISGSPRMEDSLTNVLVRHISDAASELGFDSEAWLIGEQPLPMADPAYHKDPLSEEHPVQIRKFAETLDFAQVIVLATPVYNGSYTVHLKNALDSLRWDHLKGKTVVLAAQGNPASAGIALSHLNEVARTLQGNVHNSYIVADRSTIDVESGMMGIETINRISSVLKELIKEA